MITIDEAGRAQPAANFDNPLGLIRACHDHILFHCDLLEKIMVYIAENDIDKELIDAAKRVGRYFNTAGKLHHQDEEQDLFPHLIKASMELADVIKSLKQDHIAMDTLWSTISFALDKPYSINAQQLNELTKISAEFCTLNRKHVQIEEKQLLAVATHLISNNDLKTIGQAMKSRRQL